MPASPSARTTNRPLVIVSIMAAMFMIAIEATIVSTAMPQIAGAIGGLNLYSWVFASFLLSQTAATVVCGKLADVYGRRPMVLFGIAVFLVGSVLSGLARSMPEMIAYRLLQGIGAGALQPILLTIVGDLYDARERGRVQGFLASVWAFSSVIGPLAGSLIIQVASWSWIFWINVPLGLAAAVGFVAFLREGVPREHQRLDILGAALFTVAVSALMVGLTELGPSGLPAAAPYFAAFLAAGVLFVFQERRAPEPMIALSLWGRRPIAAANGGSLVTGFGMGLLSTCAIVLIQEITTWSERASGTASNIFSRNLGSTLGATALGAVLNHGLAAAHAGGVTSEELRRLLEATPGAVIDPVVRDALAGGLHLTFVAIFVVSLATVALALLVPSVSLGRGTAAPSLGEIVGEATGEVPAGKELRTAGAP